MGSQVHQALRTLCFNTQWKYAVFWKLQHRTRMMLTWEDAYYNNNEHPEKKWFNNTMGDFHDAQYSSDPVGLAVAKMSYHVYSLGEGIVGQVAVTGKHLWISADNYAVDPGSLFEYCDGLQTQFSAGIKTIAVVAVVPHGVVQLGSLDRVAEDLRLVNHVKNIFFGIQDSIVGPISTVMKSGMESSCVSDVSIRTSGSGIHHTPIHNPDTITEEEGKMFWTNTHSPLGKQGDHPYLCTLPVGCSDTKVGMIHKDQEHKNLKTAIPENGGSQPLLGPELQNEELSSVFVTKCKEQSSSFKQFGGVLDGALLLSPENVAGAKVSSYDAPTCDYSEMDVSYFSPNAFHSAPSNEENGAQSVPELSSMYDEMDALHMPTRFFAGYELYEALGPVFQKQSANNNLAAELADTGEAMEMPEEICSSSREHLLEAVVGTVNHNMRDTKCETSCHKSAESLLTIEKMTEPCSSDVGTISSADYTFSRDTLNSLTSSGAYSIQSSKGVSSTSSCKGSGLLDRPQEPGKMQKKRARPGESCRPRPRDRQLIQDRIKELRELVPNGSKCSIDSLLERTIKHMLFMQSITKHADKLKKCTASKLLDKDPGVQGSFCNEQGSTWAVEVGSNLKVCPIIVENMNMNGQMLIEMLCDECSIFLGVAEAIRSLGLTILKGVTEAYGEKTWMRFVVEGHNNRNMHRMDILWSLMQLLQPKVNN